MRDSYATMRDFATQRAGNALKKYFDT